METNRGKNLRKFGNSPEGSSSTLRQCPQEKTKCRSIHNKPRCISSRKFVNEMPERMESLPDEIMILIFRYASTYDLATSFQHVCKRWSYLINTCERIWRGDVKLKGLTERKCGARLCNVLRKAPRLKYLQIGYPHPNALHEKLIEEAVVLEYGIGTGDILNTIRDFNKDIEYLQIIDRSPGTESLKSVINRPRFKRLSVIFDRLRDRREKITDLKKVFADVPDVDNLCINFSQRIQFQCEKNGLSKWLITHDSKTDITDEFS